MFTTEEWDTATEAMLGLQEAAVEVDAEPGMNAGLHVHVKQPRGNRNKVRAYFAFAAWEPALIDLALGRFDTMRSMNRTVRNDLAGHLLNAGTVPSGRGWRDRANDAIDAIVSRLHTGDDWEDVHYYFSLHHSADRHSNLSVNTRFQTWEFRLWNSTRSAWRMEMACRLAVAWADTGFIEALLAHDGERTVDDLLNVIAAEWQGDDRLAALVNRQIAYLPRASEAPARFLVA